MKTKTISLALTLVALCMTAGSLFAQSNMKLHATVPFDFIADGRTFAAGNYEITQLEENVLVLRNMETHSSAVESTAKDKIATEARGTNALVFNSIQGQHFLAQVTTRSAQWAHKVPESAREKEMAKANPNASPETVGVIASAGK